ncbi:MAG TPA: hypothetical protein VKT30_01310 [Caulobacteraceae bacterium]|nr:hypothetical protein [Caulobacteraceae bacterium]
MRVLLRTLAVLVSALALNGCLSVGSVANRGTIVDLGIGSMQNRGMLINIARASLSEPLYFLSPSAVQGTGSTDLRLSAPQAIEGPGLKHSDTLNQLTFGNASQFLDNTISTNFTANLFATHDFYLGMMTPLSLDEIDLLLHQGYSRELVFYLTIDKAKVTPFDPITGKQLGPPHFDYNRPGDPSFHEFQTFIQAAMEHGLMTEVAPASSGSASKGAPEVNVTPPAAGQAQTVVVVQNGAAAPEKKGPAARQTCYEPALASPVAMKDFALPVVHVNFCGSGEPTPPTQYVVLNNQAYKIEVIFRSTYGIFRYLGQIVNDPGEAPVLSDYSQDYPNGVPEFTPQGSLFKVETGHGFPGCFTAVPYEGKIYCAPSEGDGSRTTREIFNMLTALVALKQSSGDIPASSAIVIP